MTFKRMASRLQVIAFLKLIKLIKILYIRRNGIIRISFETFYFLIHYKVSCGSPCCAKLCREDNHCNVNIDTHEYVNSDSEEEHIDNK